ncbi:MAG: HAD family phosphatase [Oscillospiraceae bacterium]|jgi:HAD superfamily hydrolase (TIGR01509 family)|nr:HAD family phosphatase [Oscillospiraceae bacterium]
MIKGIVFDMDGLMIDSERLAGEALKQAMREQNLTYREEIRNSAIGRNAFVVDEIYCRAFGAEKAIIVRARMKEIISAYYQENGVPVKKGLYELLDFLETLGIKKAVASSSKRATIENLLSAIGVLGRIDAYIGGDETHKGKPDPEIFLKACERLSIAPKEALVLEDSVAGVAAAVNGGIPVVLIPDICPHTPESMTKAAAVLDDLLEVIPFIRQKNGWTDL